MFNPVRIEIVNFMSHEETVYDFKSGETTLIYGINRDDEGADSNGSGKSSIVKAITICLLDLPDSSLNKDDYIRDNCDKATLTFTLQNDVLGLELAIVREITKSGSKVSVFENGQKNTQLTSVRESNDRILELIDISKQDILNYFFINQDNSHSFFEATDQEQKLVVSRFTNSSMIDDGILRLDQDIKQLNKKIEELNTDNSNDDVELRTLYESLEYEQTTRSEEYRERVSDLNGRIEELKLQQSKYARNLVKYSESIEEINSKLSKLPKEIDSTEEREKITKYRSKVDTFQDELTQTKQFRSDLELKLSGVVTCPECSHSWNLSDPSVSLDEVKKTIEEVDQLSDTIIANVKKFSNLLRKYRDKVREKDDSLQEIRNLQNELTSSNNEITLIKKKSRATKDSISDLEGEIEKLKEYSLNKVRIKELNDKIKTIEERISNRVDKNTQLSDELSVLVFWKINLGIKGFKTFLVNKVLNVLEGYVNSHLKQFKTNLQVKINGFKKNKSGDIVEKIDILVSRDGDNWKKYRRHSGGQRQRINVCGILTIHKLINGSSKSGGLNLLVLDEFFEGLDALGQGEILNILDQSDITTLVISHNNNDVGCQNQVWLEYKDGISSIFKVT